MHCPNTQSNKENNTMSDITTDTTLDVESDTDLDTGIDSTVEETQSEQPSDPLGAALSKALDSYKPAAEQKPAGLLPKDLQTPAPKPVNEAAVTDPVTGQVLEPIKAPPWPVGVRDKWASLPRDVQEHISKREREMHENLQQTAEARKGWDEFKNIAAPYEALFRQHNMTAQAHVKELFNMSHILNTGHPLAKAQVLASLIHQFQPDAAALGQFLSNPGHQPQAAPQQPVNVRAEVEKMLQEQTEQTQQRDATLAMQAFEADMKNEFMGDVRDLMAKAIDAGLVTGSSYPELFKNAYEFACKNHPDVAAVIAQRSATKAPTVVKPAQPVRPNGSVKPSPVSSQRSTPNGKQKAMSLDDAFNAALEQHSK